MVAKFQYNTSSKEIDPSDLMVILHAPYNNRLHNNSNQLIEAELKGSGESDLVHFRGSLYSDVEIIYNEYTFESDSIDLTSIGGDQKQISGPVTLTMHLTFTYNELFRSLLQASFCASKLIDIGMYFEGPKELQMYHLYIASLNIISR